jgi:hypothetical protein
MRLTIVALLSLFILANVVGCGGAVIPEPSADAKAGPPPGTSDVWKKTATKK